MNLSTAVRSRLMTQHKLFKSDAVLTDTCDVAEQLSHDLVEVRLANRIKVVFAVASAFDQAGDSQKTQVMADCGLALS